MDTMAIMVIITIMVTMVMVVITEIIIIIMYHMAEVEHTGIPTVPLLQAVVVNLIVRHELEAVERAAMYRQVHLQ